MVHKYKIKVEQLHVLKQFLLYSVICLLSIIFCFSVSVDSFLSLISLSFFWLCILSMIGLFVNLHT